MAINFLAPPVMRIPRLPIGEGSFFLARGHKISEADFKEQLEHFLEEPELSYAKAQQLDRSHWTETAISVMGFATVGTGVLWEKVPKGSPGALEMTSLEYVPSAKAKGLGAPEKKQ